MGKGSQARPIPDRKTFESNFDAIFGKKKKSDDTSPHLIEYELNKSTGELERLYEGTSKPNSEQFEKNFDAIFRKPIQESIKDNEELYKALAEYELNKSTGEVQKKED